jgi:hypothetical protein
MGPPEVAVAAPAWRTGTGQTTAKYFPPNAEVLLTFTAGATVVFFKEVRRPADRQRVVP